MYYLENSMYIGRRDKWSETFAPHKFGMCLGLETPHQFAADHFYTINMFGIKSHLKVLIELNAWPKCIKFDSCHFRQLWSDAIKPSQSQSHQTNAQWVRSTLEVCNWKYFGSMQLVCDVTGVTPSLRSGNCVRTHLNTTNSFYLGEMTLSPSDTSHSQLLLWPK